MKVGSSVDEDMHCVVWKLVEAKRRHARNGSIGEDKTMRGHSWRGTGPVELMRRHQRSNEMLLQVLKRVEFHALKPKLCIQVVVSV